MLRLQTAFIAAAAIAVGASVTGAAAAQSAQPSPVPDPMLPAPNRTIPEQTYPCNPGAFEPSPKIDDPNLQQTYDCESVIEPPPGIDAEIKVRPPDPDPGSMPVIPPAAIEPQT